MNAWPFLSVSGSAISRLYARLGGLLSDEASGLLESERTTINMILRDRCVDIESLDDEVADAVCEFCSRRRDESSLVHWNAG